MNNTPDGSSHGLLTKYTGSGIQFAQQNHVFDKFPIAIYICGRDGSIQYYNEEAARIWGRRPATGEPGERFNGAYKLYLPDGEYLPHNQAPEALCLVNGMAVKNFELVIEGPDLSRRTVSVNVTPSLDEKGRQEGVVACLTEVTRCFTIDVTEEKWLFRALAESELRYKTLINNLPVAVYTCNMDGRITYFNDIAPKLWGFCPDTNDDSLRYCACHKVFVNGVYIRPDETPMAVTLQTGRSFRNEQAVVERPDGSRFYASVNIDPIYDEANNIVGAINVFQDVSAIKLAEQNLQESEANYRRLASTLEIKIREKMTELKKTEDRYHRMIEEVEDYAIILLDQEGTIVNWNKGAEKIKGYKEEEIIGKSFQEFYLPEDRQNGLPLMLLKEAMAAGKAVHEGWRKRKDGSRFWGSVVLTALHGEDGTIIGVCKVTRDLTERKLAEDRTREYLANLEFQNKELEQFVYAASHDLKEPLRKIHLYSSYVAGNSANVLDATSITYLARSVAAAERMKTLIEDLLTYSRATANVEAYVEVDLNELVEELISYHKEEFGQNPLSIEKNDLATIRAVPFQMKQLIGNLIGNAVKYRHPDRELRITVNNEIVSGDRLVAFKADPRKQYYKISVMDNGIGFDPQYADRIFKIFQRLASSAGVKGSGMGLAICTKIAQNHNGFINAEGVPGKGASFHVYLPKN